MTSLMVDGSVSYRIGREEFADRSSGSKVIFKYNAPPPVESLKKFIASTDEAALADLVSAAPIASSDPYVISSHQIVMIPNATVYVYPRIEGIILDESHNFIRETRGSPRILQDNNFIRIDDKGNFYFAENQQYDYVLEKAFVGFDPATANFAHFLGVFLQRIMFANYFLKDMPIAFPDLPNYKEHQPGVIRNEFMFRLEEIEPSVNGNFYFPLRPGKYFVRELYMLQQIRNRWDLMFYPEINQKLVEISERAASRANIIKRKSYSKRIYISRKNATHRRVTNEEQVIELLSARGFEIITSEKFDFWEQIMYFRMADTIVSLHGAGCANILFCPLGTNFIELYPNILPSWQFINTAVAMGLKYFGLSCKKVSRFGDVEVDVSKLAVLLDTVGV